LARSTGSAFMAPRMTPGVKRLMIINFVVYIVYLLMLRSNSLAFIANELALTPQDMVFGGRLWQPVTYMFIHHPAAVGHLLGNMLMLFFFGTGLEQMVGTKKLIRVYIYSGLGGALLTLVGPGLAALIAPGSGLSQLWYAPHLGASGAVFGLVLCWGGMQWGETANFFLLGPMKIRTFILVIVGIEVLHLLSLGQGSSYTAHFGGMAVGFFIGRGGSLSELNPRKAAAKLKHKQTQKKLQRFEVIEGGGEGSSNGASKPTWMRRDDDDDPIVH
jgi:membrane associated rhomboid family serine protease